MVLINRIARLFRADMHAVLDQLEEPEVLLRQAIREMEYELDAFARLLTTRRQEQRAMAGRRDALQGSLAELDEHLDVCFQSEEHELARDLTRKKIETQRLLQVLQNQIEEADSDLQDREAALAEKRSTLAGLIQKAEIFAAETQAAGQNHDHEPWHRSDLYVAESEVEAAFLKELNARAAR